MVLLADLSDILAVNHFSKTRAVHCWPIELRCTTVEGLLFTIFEDVVTLLNLSWYHFFIDFIGGNLLTFDIFWLIEIGQAFVLGMAVASIYRWFTLGTREGKVCWSAAHSVDAELHV